MSARGRNGTASFGGGRSEKGSPILKIALLAFAMLRMVVARRSAPPPITRWSTSCSVKRASKRSGLCHARRGTWFALSRPSNRQHQLCHVVYARLPAQTTQGRTYTSLRDVCNRQAFLAYHEIRICEEGPGHGNLSFTRQHWWFARMKFYAINFNNACIYILFFNRYSYALNKSL